MSSVSQPVSLTKRAHRHSINILTRQIVIYEETRGVLKTFLEGVIRDAVTYTGMFDASYTSGACTNSIYRARQAQDRHFSRCRLRSQASRPNPLRFRWLNYLSTITTSSRHSTYLSFIHSRHCLSEKLGSRWAHVTFDSLSRRSSMLFTAGFHSSIYFHLLGMDTSTSNWFLDLISSRI